MVSMSMSNHRTLAERNLHTFTHRNVDRLVRDGIVEVIIIFNNLMHNVSETLVGRLVRITPLRRHRPHRP